MNVCAQAQSQEAKRNLALVRWEMEGMMNLCSKLSTSEQAFAAFASHACFLQSDLTNALKFSGAPDFPCPRRVSSSVPRGVVLRCSCAAMRVACLCESDEAWQCVVDCCSMLEIRATWLMSGAAFSDRILCCVSNCKPSISENGGVCVIRIKQTQRSRLKCTRRTESKQ